MPSPPRPPGPKGLPILGSALAYRRDPSSAVSSRDAAMQVHAAITLRPEHPVRLRIHSREVSHG